MLYNHKKSASRGSNMYSVKPSVFLKNIKILASITLVVFFLQRTSIFVWSFHDIKFDFIQALQAFILGFLFDCSMFVYAMIPVMLFWMFSPKFKKEQTVKTFGWIGFNFVNFIFVFLVLFAAVSELFFWDEFTARYNFIAVDYLVYTTEVLKNIWESYPTFKIISGIAIAAFAILYVINKKLNIEVTEEKVLKNRLKVFAAYAVVLGLNFLIMKQDYSLIPKDVAYQEISKNGTYSLFYSYFENQINYDQFYMQVDNKQAVDTVKTSMPDGEYKSKEVENIKREVVYPQTGQKMNVMLVLMESMGARFMSPYGNTEKITPNLDRLASEGLFYDNIYATGTRTVRGIEAITLSLPPTPGQSIVRRPNNEKLVTINSYFAKAGYEVEFLYGGVAFFDNMKYFFENNDAKVLDLKETEKGEVHFSNAWGMSDEDLYKFAVKNADIAYNDKKPFFQIILTTSNHRPFTYPEGKIDIPSGSGRSGAVKYSDYSIGKFIEEVKTKPWFDNTVFVFVADHDAGVAGNKEVYKKDYLIPLIFYSPKLIKPETVSKLGSQIDVGPTLLGLLNMSHDSFGMGYDLRKSNSLERAFISNYQKIGYMKTNFLTLLEPGKKFKQYKISGKDYQDADLEKDELNSTISFYQTASHLFKDNKLKSGNEKLVK
jgi:phosphoglycerol transferase MdoB-like AlkP superfamily enzyme